MGMKKNIRLRLALSLIGLSCVLSICAANIEITEVFYDGNDEWIELTNTSNEIFSGEVVLSGAKSSSITLHLVFNPGEIKVI